MDTQNRKAQLQVGLDATGVKQGAQEVVQAADRMGDAVKQSATKAATGVDGMGASAERAAAKLTRAEQSIVNSIQRTTAAAAAGGRETAGYFEALARQRGISVDNLRPYLSQLEAARARQDALNLSLGNVGMTAKQTTAALRQVPAQFTDIAVSLAGGQNPLTVLLQQGGQLKDVFGGVGAAARALGGYVVSLINPLTVAAGVAGSLAVAFYQGSKEAQEFQRALILSGNAAGLTADQLQEMSAAVDDVVGTQAQAAEVLTALASSGGIAQESIQGVAATIVGMSQVGGASVEQLVKDFADLGREPTKAIERLNGQYRFLTAATYEQISALERQGEVEKAAALATQTYARVVDDKTVQLRDNLNFLQEAWIGLKKVAGETWDAMSGTGRDVSFGEQIADLQARRDRFAQRGGFAPGQSRQEVLNDYNLQIGRLRTEQLQAEAAARRQAAQFAEEQRRIAAIKAWREDEKRYLTDKAKQEAEVERIRTQGKAAGIEQAQIEARVAAFREQSARKSVTSADTAAKSAARELQTAGQRLEVERAQLAMLRARGLAADSLNEGERKAIQIQEELKGKLSARTRALKEQELAMAKSLGSVIAEREALQDSLKAREDLVKAQERQATAVADSVQRLLDEERAAALAAAENISLARALERVAIARTREALEKARAEGQDQRVLDALQAEIAAREKLVGLIAAKEVREEAVKRAEEARTAWERTAAQIEEALTDALMRGFESGKGFAENMRDTVVNMFKTMVLRPVVQAIVSPVAAALSGAAPGTAMAGQGGGVDMFGSLLSSDIFGDFGMGLTNFLYGAGGSLTDAGLGSLGNVVTDFAGTVSGLSSTVTSLGNAAGYLGSIYSASQGNWGAAAGTAIGTYFGGPIGAAIGGALGGLLDGGYEPVGSGGYYSSRGMAQTRASALEVTNGYGSAADDLIKRGNPQTRAWLQNTVEAVIMQSTTLAAMLGKEARIAVDAGFAYAVDEPQYYGYADVFINDQKVHDYVNRNLGGDADAAAATFVKDLRDSIAKALLKDSGLIRAGEAASDTMTALADSLTTVNGLFKVMGRETLDATIASAGLARDLTDLFGGTDATTSALGSFFEAYYSDAEKARISAELLAEQFRQLNVAMPTTKAGLRGLVDDVDLTTESGRALYAALINLAPAFGTLVDSMEAVSTGIEQEVARIRALATPTQTNGTLVEAQALFAMRTAAARSGDQMAIEALPALSQALLKLGEQVSTSAVEYQLLQSSTLRSLEETLAIVRDPSRLVVPAYADGGMFGGGLRLVGENGPELEVTGPARIYSASQTAGLLADAGSSASLMREVIAELKALREDGRTQSAVLASNTGKAARILESVTPDGTSLSTKPAT